MDNKGLHSTLRSPAQAMCRRMESPLQARCRKRKNEPVTKGHPNQYTCGPPCKQGATESLHSTLWSPPQAMCHQMVSPLQARCHQKFKLYNVVPIARDVPPNAVPLVNKVPQKNEIEPVTKGDRLCTPWSPLQARCHKEITQYTVVPTASDVPPNGVPLASKVPPKKT